MAKELMTLEKALVMANTKKFRFNTHLGQLSVEELYDKSFPLQSRGNAQTSLDSLAIALKKKLDSAGEITSFVSDTVSGDRETEAKFVIVKSIIDRRLAANAAAETRAKKQAQKARILALLEEKQESALSEKSADELKDLLAETETVEDDED